MKICESIEDLTCENCIHCDLEFRDDGNTYLSCNYRHDGKVRHTFGRKFCGEKGEWSLNVKTRDYHWSDGKKIEDEVRSNVKVLTREYAIQAIMNSGEFDW